MIPRLWLCILMSAAACGGGSAPSAPTTSAPTTSAPTTTGGGTPGGTVPTATDIPLTARPHMDAATLALYNKVRGRAGWLLGVGVLATASNPFATVASSAVPARWQELYGSSTPASIEWEMAEQNNPSVVRDWTGLSAFAASGGLPWIRISMNNFTVPYVRGSTPPPQGGMNDTRGGAAAVLPGGSAHAAFMTWAQQLAREVKAVGKPVVLRPLHEGDGQWFWWGGHAANYIALWRQLFQVFQDEGTRNVIWLWATGDVCPNSTCIASGFYPGDAYVDMLGVDLYFTAGSLPASAHSSLAMLESLGLDKPVVISEFGPAARADFWQQAPAALAGIKRFRGFSLWLARGWNIWNGGGSLVDASSDAATRAAFAVFLADSRVLSLASFQSSR